MPRPAAPRAIAPLVGAGIDDLARPWTSSGWKRDAGSGTRIPFVSSKLYCAPAIASLLASPVQPSGSAVIGSVSLRPSSASRTRCSPGAQSGNRTAPSGRNSAPNGIAWIATARSATVGIPTVIVLRIGDCLLMCGKAQDHRRHTGGRGCSGLAPRKRSADTIFEHRPSLGRA